jgi:hypothetical protein
MDILFQSAHEPKSLQLEKTEDGRYRLVITLNKLGAVSALEYFLDQTEAQLLREALAK